MISDELGNGGSAGCADAAGADITETPAVRPAAATTPATMRRTPKRHFEPAIPLPFIER
ncbi:hypothetical protein RE0356_22250 [Prescottella equi]|nr:hypothetical protein RE0356_22250 [Prescottella equi]